jgi:hypothetical protein
MRLPTEPRLFIVENILEDFFASLTLGLYPPYPVILWFQLPYIKELYSVLHVSRALRAESLDLCIELATNSSEEVLNHPPSASIADRYHRRTIGSFPHALLKLKHKRILEILQQAKVSAGDAEQGGGVRVDLIKALGSAPRRLVGRRSRERVLV